MESTIAVKVDASQLELKVKKMYSDVALYPKADYHFEMGRGLAERLGYASADLDRIPASATDSFAGVGYYFDVAELREGENVLDLGSGSGMDVFVAALKVGKTGHVSGVDMTNEQLQKSERLRVENGFDNVSFHKSYIEKLPFADATFDVVISNGVINLCPDKAVVFAEVARVLKPGGRMAIADIVTEKQLPDSVVCDSTLWAACIGGAAQEDNYRAAITHGGMDVQAEKTNSAYGFISKSARGAAKQYGVKSVTILSVKQPTQPVAQSELLASGQACVYLTPMINKAMSQLQDGQVLKVLNDDPASRLGVPAWCRITGQTLLEQRLLDDSNTEFYIQKNFSKQ